MALIQNNATEKTGILDFQIAPSVKTENGAEFEKVMQNTKDAPSNQQLKQKPAAAAEKPDARETMKAKLAAASSKAQDKIAATEIEADPETVMEAVGALLENIKMLLTDVFQISTDELAGLMEEMNLTDMDLLNPELLNQLAVQLTGAEDAMELLFQPELMDNLKNLNTAVAALKQETFAQLGLSEKEVQGILDSVQNRQENPSQVLVQKEPQTVQEKEVQEPVQAEGEVPAETVVQKDTQRGETKDSGEKDTDHQQMQPMANPVVEGIRQAVEEILPESDAENVVKQVVEQIRVSIKADTSSFEMQLNPEHLGKINLQVAAKNGVVTAQIATENAAVKEALESQLLTLKESLSQQGIKVEAVEVTVASHEFERNLDEQQEQSQQQGEQKKRFRFDVMDAAEEELTPADAVMRDMMLANGNQLNMMA